MEESRRDREQAFANLVRAYRKNHIGKGPEKIKGDLFLETGPSPTWPGASARLSDLLRAPIRDG